MCLTIKLQTGAINRHLLWAILISGLLHGYFLYKPIDRAPIKQPQSTSLTVALTPKAVIAPVKPVPKSTKPPKPTVKKAQSAKQKPKAKALAKIAKPRKIVTQVPKVISAAPIVQPISPASQPTIVETPWVETKKVVAKAEEPEWAIKQTAAVDTSLPEVIDEAVTPYLQVHSVYDVYADTAQQQASRAVLGKAKMVYQREQEAYTLNSEVRPSGIMRLFLDDLIQQSHGKVTPQGLQPDYFLYQYDEKKYEVNFDWASQQLKIHTHKGDKNAVMQAGTQDLLSFMFQFMFRSPLEQTGMMITNGKSVREYQYQFIGEALIETKIGVFNTVHIVRDDPVKNEQLALWLARDYQYLPVRIKKSKPNKNKNYELLIRALQTDQGVVQGEQSTKTSVKRIHEADSNALKQTKTQQSNLTPAKPYNPLIQR